MKPQGLKSQSTIDQQPQKLTSKANLIMAMDIAGYKGTDIARALKVTPQNIYVIRNSPTYIEKRKEKWTELQKQVLDKQTTKIVAGDPIEVRIKQLAGRAVDEYVSLLNSAESEMVRKATADSILDRAGYKPKSDKIGITVEVTEKMSQRFERVLGKSVIVEQL